ncbi:MAG: WD40 repeat domain-containing protein [Myxococcota bacterium]|jgi:WD40 repeat protein
MRVLTVAFVIAGLSLITVARAAPDYAALEQGAPLRMVLQTGTTGPVYSLAFSPDSRLLAVGGGDGAIRLWTIHSLTDGVYGIMLPGL